MKIKLRAYPQFVKNEAKQGKVDACTKGTEGTPIFMEACESFSRSFNEVFDELRIRSRFFAFLIALIVTSCNHVYYQPEKEMRLKPSQFSLKYDDIKIQTTDGESLNAWLIHAADEKPMATIVHFHGNGENMSTHFLYFSWLAEANFDVIDFDYRGYGNSTGTASRLGLYNDTLAVLDWVKKNARSPNLFIAAQSLGTAVVIPAITDSTLPNLKAVILESSFSSYRKLAQTKLSSLWLTWPLQWPLSFLISDELSPIDYIKNIHVPLLFIHSQNDVVVPYESGKELFDAANEPKQFWLVKWDGHTAAFNQRDGRYRIKLLYYLKEYLNSRKDH